MTYFLNLFTSLLYRTECAKGHEVFLIFRDHKRSGFRNTPNAAKLANTLIKLKLTDELSSGIMNGNGERKEPKKRRIMKKKFLWKGIVKTVVHWLKSGDPAND